MAVMNAIDRIYTKRPYYGVPRITKQLKEVNITVNHKRVYRLMKIMGIEGLRPAGPFEAPSAAVIRRPR